MGQIIQNLPTAVALMWLILLTTVDLSSQDTTVVKDDLWYANDYFTKAWRIARRDLEKAELYADSSRYLYEKAGDQKGLKRMLFLRGGLERAKGNFNKSKENFTQYLDIAIAQQDTEMIGNSYFQLGILNEHLGDLDLAVEQLYKATEYHEAINDSSSIAINTNSIGSIQRKLKQYDIAETEYRRALAINRQLNKLDGIATNLVNLGNLYGEQGQYDDAILQYREAIKYDSLTQFDYGLAFDYQNIGQLYAKQEKYIEAEEPFLKALALREKLGGKWEIGLSNNDIGNLYQKLGRYKLASDYLEKAKELAEESEALELQRDVNKSLSNLYEKTGSYKQSLAYLKEHNILNDSIINKSTADKIAALNVEFETTKKEQEIALLNTENELTNTKLTAAKRQAYGLLAGMLIFAGLLYMVFRLYRKTQSQNALISKALSEKETLLREIHHRVKNNLQFISSLLGLQTEHVKDKAALGALEEGQNRVQSMALIHQNLYQEDNLKGVDMKEYFTKLIRGLFDSYNIRKDQIRLEMNIDDLNLDVDTVIPIGLIVNELVSNSLKYAFPGDTKGNIVVAMKEQQGSLILKVSDDGIGMSSKAQKELGKSFGYRLVNVFSDQLNADLDIVSDDGTIVTLLIKKFQKAG